MINSTFGGFMTARLGMTVAQQALNITGQNISNISTLGYTRQRVDQVSFNVGGGSNRYSSFYNVNIGNGALVTGISQIRDPFLDKRFRAEMAQVGEYDIKISGLKELSSILDEASKVDDEGGIHNQIGDLLSKLDKLASNVGNKEFDSMVKSSAQVLTELLNSAAKQLEEVRKNQETDLKDVDIPAVNNLLNNIRDLNKSIKEANLHGNAALELKDQRNLLIDELSSYLDIEVKYDTVKYTDSISVEELSIELVGKDGKKITLVDDEQARQLELTSPDQNGTEDWKIGLTKLDPDDKELDFKIAEAQQKLQKEMDAVKNATDKLTEAQKLLTDANNTLNNANAAFTAAQADTAAKQTAADKAKADYEAIKANPNSTKDQITAARKVYDEARAALKTAEKAEVKAQTALTNAQAEADKAQKKVDDLNTEIAELQKTEKDRIDAAQKELDKANKDKQDSLAAGAAIGDITDDILTGSLKSSLDLLNDDGEFDQDPNATRGIGYYQNMLDSLANKIATTLNEANNPYQFTDGAGQPVEHNLFETNDGTDKITAGNIKIADGWNNNEYGITASKDPNAPEGANDNILHMKNLFTESMVYDTNGDGTGTKLFEGTYQEFFSNMGVVLGLDIKSSTEILNNHVQLAGSISDDRDNVSGVSLDEDGMNMLQYSKAYSASARMMTVLDEALDTIINKMGVVGR